MTETDGLMTEDPLAYDRCMTDDPPPSQWDGQGADPTQKSDKFGVPKWQKRSFAVQTMQFHRIIQVDL